jgi:hypothetical protein
MSNKSIFKLCLVIALSIAATSAYGAATTISGQLQIGGGTFSPSNKVTITYDSGPASDNASSYVAKSKHSAGDRIIATSNADPKMYYSQVDVSVVTPASASTDTFGGNAWTSM